MVIRTLSLLFPAFLLSACGNASADSEETAQSQARSGREAQSTPTPEGTSGREIQPANLPREVVAYAGESRQSCEEEGGRFSITNRYYETGDFNGDGAPDFVLSPNFDCALPDGTGAMFFAGGTAGPSLTVLVSGRNGYVHAASVSAHEMRIARRGDRDVLLFVGGHGITVDGNYAVWAWNDGEMQLSGIEDPQGRPLDGNGRPLAAGAAESVMPPLPIGYYVMEPYSGHEGCEDIAGDGSGAYHGYLSSTDFEEEYGGCSNPRFSRTGEGRWRASYECEDEGGSVETFATDYRMTSLSSFGSTQLSDEEAREVRWNYCAPARVTEAARFYGRR